MVLATSNITPTRKPFILASFDTAILFDLPIWHNAGSHKVVSPHRSYWVLLSKGVRYSYWNAIRCSQAAATHRNKVHQHEPAHHSPPADSPWRSILGQFPTLPYRLSSTRETQTKADHPQTQENPRSYHGTDSGKSGTPKKPFWEDLSGLWVFPDIRDEISERIDFPRERTAASVRKAVDQVDSNQRFTVPHGQVLPEQTIILPTQERVTCLLFQLPGKTCISTGTGRLLTQRTHAQ